ncbi:MAG: hypothetical protein K8F25_06205, partial [Fimbriimonadaceae bacterium]|nr:hypothetical protein [Alphaproteobacteria bacterium]
CKYHKDMLPHALILIMEQLARPAEIVRLAKKFVGTDDAIKIESHAYRATVEIVLYDIRCRVKEIGDALDRDEDIAVVGKMITSYRNLMHSLQIELTIPTSSAWSKMITQLRSKLSERLSSKLNEAPRLIKTALKADSDGMNEPAKADVDAAESALQLMQICRSSSDELALNELLSRLRREIEQFMNAMGDAAVESLRRSTPKQRSAAKARADIAVFLSRIVFGDEIADLLYKAAHIAMKSTEDSLDFKLADSA